MAISLAAPSRLSIFDSTMFPDGSKIVILIYRAVQFIRRPIFSRARPPEVADIFCFVSPKRWGSELSHIHANSRTYVPLILLRRAAASVGG
ncbi:MAG TPA: hypothetical protein VFC78_00615 [Tepidisphaeraceae bacterium]|nr:hypothetical protein [Tepidisphaeraceae bacterium]